MENRISWVDKSTFARGDTVRTPNAFEYTLSQRITLRLHRHIDYPGKWVLDARMVDIERHALNATEQGAAQAEAVTYALEVLKARRDDLDTAISALQMP